MKKNNDRLGQKLAIKYFRVFVISDNEVPNTAIKDERYLVTWLNLAKIQERLYESSRPTLVITKNKSQFFLKANKIKVWHLFMISCWTKKKTCQLLQSCQSMPRGLKYVSDKTCLFCEFLLILNLLPWRNKLKKIILT